MGGWGGVFCATCCTAVSSEAGSMQHHLRYERCINRPLTRSLLSDHVPDSCSPLCPSGLSDCQNLLPFEHFRHGSLAVCLKGPKLPSQFPPLPDSPGPSVMVTKPRALGEALLEMYFFFHLQSSATPRCDSLLQGLHFFLPYPRVSLL